MKTEHTPEPWRVGRRGNDVVGSNGLVDTVAMMIDCDSDEQTHANARRIVTCVNACEGMDDAEISRGLISTNHYSTVVNERDELKAINAELLAFAERAADVLEYYNENKGVTRDSALCELFELANAAIAKAKQ